MANRELYESVSEHPKAVEIVSFVLETKTRNFFATADILPDRDMGEVKWTEGQMEGRFANLLGDKPELN